MEQRPDRWPGQLTAAVVRGNTELRVRLDEDVPCVCVEIDGTPCHVLLGVTAAGAENLRRVIATGWQNWRSGGRALEMRLRRAPMGNNGRSSFEHYREIVYALLRQYTDALDDPDDRAVATLARTELPRYVRYWTALLAEHEPKAGEKCPSCSRWWRKVSVPCATWKWAHAFLTLRPARARVPSSRLDKPSQAHTRQPRTVAT